MSVLMSLMLIISGAVQTQTDWVSGSGTLGPVPSWGSAFYQSTDINYNITGQISLVAMNTSPVPWPKHIIEFHGGIDGHGGLVPADFDGDGDIDVAGAIHEWHVMVYRNNLVPDGAPVTFTKMAWLNDLPIIQYCLIWAGDLDGDGDADIVVPSSSADGWYENDGTGTFTFAYHQIGTHDSIARGACDVADVDSDGDMDVVVYGHNATTDRPLYLWRNDGAMNFTYELIAATGKRWRVALGDLNNDGYPDLLNADDVYLNSGGSFPGTPSWTWGRASNDVDAIWIRDVDNDGDKDLLLTERPGGLKTLWFENDGTGTGYTPHVVFPPPRAYNYSAGCVAEDINLDGLADVVGCYSMVGFFKQFGPDEFHENWIGDVLEAHYVSVANLDHKPCGSDLDLDVLVSYHEHFAWYENPYGDPSRVTFATAGDLESSIFEVADPAAWEALLWDGSRTPTTTLSFYVRTGADATEIQTNPWQGPFDVPLGQCSGEFDITAATTAGHRFFQYRVAMGGDGSESPVVYELAVRYNDYDVAATEIVQPTGTIDYNTTVTPECKVYNYGSATESYTVRMRIGDFYDQTADVTDHMPLTEVTVTFPDWVAVQIGTHAVSCSTELATDIEPTNDKVIGEVTVLSGADTPEPWTGDMKGQGYWKNHPYYDPKHPEHPYIGEYIPVTVAGEEVNTVPEALAIFTPPKPMTAWKMFLIQSLAARLNAGWQTDPDLLDAWYNYPSGDYPFDNQQVSAVFEVADGYRATTDEATLDEMRTVFWNMNRYRDDTTRCLWDAPFPPGPGPEGTEVTALTPELGLSVAPSLVKSGIVRIAYSLPKAAPSQLTVLDITGRTVMTQGLPAAVGGNVVTLDASSWGAGVYILKMRSDACNLTRKVVIE